jgi:D-lactate dehydrogenase (cytochrome)
MGKKLVGKQPAYDSISVKVISDTTQIRERYAEYLHDESRLSGGTPAAVYLPETSEQVAWSVAQAARKQAPVRISGARTGLVGGAVPLEHEHVISLEHLRYTPVVSKKQEKDYWTVRAGAGMSLEELQQALRENRVTFADTTEDTREERLPEGLFYPVDPTEISASIGGTVATNASGARTFFYGQTRDWVEGITVVLADGSILEMQRGQYTTEDGSFTLLRGEEKEESFTLEPVNVPAVKHTGGYLLRPPMDLIDLFIGSEGTLGIITEVELRLSQSHPQHLYLCIFFPHRRVLPFIEELEDNVELDLLALEYMDSRSLDLLRDYREQAGESTGVPPIPEYSECMLYVEVGFQEETQLFSFYENIEDLLSRHQASVDTTWAGFEYKDLEQMKQFRHALPERINMIVAERKQHIPTLTKIATDMSVPLEKLEEIITLYADTLDKEGFEYYMFGHIGNGHLHINILPRDEGEQGRAWEVYKYFAREVVKRSGSVSAEHGIGTLKKDFMSIQYTEKELESMKALKQFFDPDWILNQNLYF